MDATRVTITIEVDDEFADPNHSSGLTEAGHDALFNAVNSVGTVADGPTKI